MPYRAQRRLANAEAAPYRSVSCRIGTHLACAESAPAAAPVDVPVVYEACDCPCHSAPSRLATVKVKQ